MAAHPPSRAPAATPCCEAVHEPSCPSHPRQACGKRGTAELRLPAVLESSCPTQRWPARPQVKPDPSAPTAFRSSHRSLAAESRMVKEATKKPAAAFGRVAVRGCSAVGARAAVDCFLVAPVIASRKAMLHRSNLAVSMRTCSLASFNAELSQDPAQVCPGR